MDDGALQALVAVLKADHALHMCGCCLLRGQAECDWSLRELLAALRWEVAHNLSLRQIEKATLETQKARTEQDMYGLYLQEMFPERN